MDGKSERRSVPGLKETQVSGSALITWDRRRLACKHTGERPGRSLAGETPAVPGNHAPSYNPRPQFKNKRSHTALNLEHLEFFLERKGYSLGFLEQSPDRRFVAWIILSKRKPNKRLISILDPNAEPEFFREQELYRERPYQVQRIEYRRDEPISVEDDIDDDLLIRELHYFRDLTEVEEYVSDFGHTLAEIKWLPDIKPP